MRHDYLLLLLGTLLASPAPALTLSGRVTDSAGSGVHPVDIDVRVSSTGQLLATPGDTTDAQGFYSMSVPGGVYDISFVPAAGSHLFTKTFKSQNLVALNTTLNVTVVRGHYLSGRVTDGAAQGLATANLNFHAPVSGDPPLDVEGDATDSLGFFTALVDSNVWDVEILAPLPARLVPRRFPAVDLRLDQSLGTVALSPGRLVQGTITDQGFFPIADADLDVRPAGSRTKLWTPQDNTGPDGSWSLVLAPGGYDISAGPPPGQPYANVTARSITVAAADVAVPNLMLPPGFELRGRCQDPNGIPIAGVDVDVDSLPFMQRLETPNDASDAGGDFRVLVSTWKFRVTLSPPVAAKLLPIRHDSLQISGPGDLGDLRFPRGHWVSGTVVEAGSGTPIAGANLDFIRQSNGSLAITPGDRTDALGAFQVTTDTDLYRLRVSPPGAAHDTLTVDPFASRNDTTVTLALTPRSVGVPPPQVAAGRLVLGAPWPNPAGGAAAVWLEAASGPVELSVWDVAGRRLATLYRGEAAAGRVARWDGRDDAGRAAAAGLYYLRLTDGHEAVVGRLVLLR